LKTNAHTTGKGIFDGLRKRGFDVVALHHAEAILEHDLSSALNDLESTLLGIELPVLELIRSGGGEGQLTQRLRNSLSESFGWKKHIFEIKKIIDGELKESITHEIDHVRKYDRGTIALEIEWNNKDPFFDRDLENFKRLHADGVISIGVIITRGKSLQDDLRGLIEQCAFKNGINCIEEVKKYYTPTPRQIDLIEKSVVRYESFEKGWSHFFVSDKFGEATTHWRKLEDRIHRGVGNPCPLLLIGIPSHVAVI
jgi:hypothetical protein